MTISRSKSALLDHSHPVAFLEHGTLARTQTRRSKSSAAISRAGPTRIAYPSGDASAKDPFFLSNFFPSRLSSVESGEEWEWLRTRNQTTEQVPMSVPAEDKVNALQTHTGDSLALEDETLDVIECEDKLGILTLDRFTFMIPSERELQNELLSPFSEGSHTDDESLFHVLSTLRKTYSTPCAHETDDVRTRFPEGGLFSVRTEEGDNVLEYGNAGSLVYRGMRMAIDILDLGL